MEQVKAEPVAWMYGINAYTYQLPDWSPAKALEVPLYTAAAINEAAQKEKEPRKQFPILGSNGAKIDWQLVQDHGKQARDNHSQTVQRLAERGGLSWCELYAVLHNQRWQRMDQNEALLACRALEARYLTAIEAHKESQHG